MGVLLDFLMRVAITATAAWLIAEVVSYFVTKQNLRQIIIEKKNSSQFQNAVCAMIKNNNGHECSFDMLDSFDNNLGSGKVSSDIGISNDIQSGDIIIL